MAKKEQKKAASAPVFARPEPNKPAAPAASSNQQQKASAQAVAAKEAVKTQQQAAAPPQQTSKQEIKAARQDPTIAAVAKELGIQKLDKPAELARINATIAQRQRDDEARRAAAAQPVEPERPVAASPPPPVTPAVDLEAIKRTAREEALAEVGDYARRFEDSLAQYQRSLSTQTSALQSQLSSAQAERDSAKAERDSEKAKAEALDKQRREEESLAADSQLRSLRSGSTIAGMPGAGLGSLQSGRASYSASTGGKRGGVLDRAFQDMDPTDSVLNRDVASEIAKAVGAGGSRAQARQRALVSGGGASRYYARRFG